MGCMREREIKMTRVGKDEIRKYKEMLEIKRERFGKISGNTSRGLR